MSWTFSEGYYTRQGPIELLFSGMIGLSIPLSCSHWPIPKIQISQQRPKLITRLKRIICIALEWFIWFNFLFFDWLENAENKLLSAWQHSTAECCVEKWQNWIMAWFILHKLTSKINSLALWLSNSAHL